MGLRDGLMGKTLDGEVWGLEFVKLDMLAWILGPRDPMVRWKIETRVYAGSPGQKDPVSNKRKVYSNT